MHHAPDSNTAMLGYATRGSNHGRMRAYNERLVLSLLRRAGPLPKAEIARITGLSPQTVSVIITALQSDSLVEKGPRLRGKIGQPSVPILLAQDGAFFFGLKIGRRSLDLVLTDFLGNIRARAHRAHAYPEPGATVQFAASAMQDLLAQLPPDLRGRVAGMGIALPFGLWGWTETLGVDAAQMQGWRSRDIPAEIAALCDFPVYSSNDASAACGAELVFGAQTRPRNFLYFYVGYFIGGGLVLDHELVTGPHGNAAAFGSLRVFEPGSPPAPLVDIASLALLENALADAGAPPLDWAAPQLWDLPPAITEPWLARAANGIAQAACAAIHVVDAGHVLIDGWMPAPLRAALTAQVQTRLSALAGPDAQPGMPPITVQTGSIGPDARTLGAASLPLSRRFLIDSGPIPKGTNP
ncbi:MAG: ROK family transcriptional regulator [Sulfitobacter sp.]